MRGAASCRGGALPDQMLDVEKGRRECAGWMRVTGVGAGIDSRVAGRARAPPANHHDHGEDLPRRQLMPFGH